MQTIRTPDATWLDLRKPERFKIFFEGLIEHLKKNLQLIRVEGSHEYYTCGQYYHRRNRNWKPFGNLWNVGTCRPDAKGETQVEIPQG